MRRVARRRYHNILDRVVLERCAGDERVQTVDELALDGAMVADGGGAEHR